MKPQLSKPQWLSLPIEVRAKLIEIFHLTRSGFTEVVDGKVTSDGYTHEDLAKITLEQLQEILDSDGEDYFSLLEELIESIEKGEEEEEEIVEETNNTPSEKPKVVTSEKPKRKRSNAKGKKSQ